ncbi:hypothetical protein C8Q80DRAFT_1265156 [Daedaleopsis nitida]|nr:hypothetical protein C8Q80DRAFT_1265156 [Daedaleopsis nitida]
MADVAQPLQAPEATQASADLPRDSVMEEHATSPTPAPVAEKANKGKGIRALRDRIALRRSFSTKHSSLSSPTLLSPTSEQHAPEVQDETGPISPKRAKANPLERLMSGKLGAKRSAKKSKEVETDGAAIPVALDAAPSTTSASSQPEVEKALASIPEGDATAPHAEDTSSPAPTDADAMPLARKIHSLLSSLPPFLSTVDPSAPDTDGNAKDGGSSKSPDTAPPIPDSRLLSLLASPSYMNGSISRGRQSVWTMLDNLRLKALKSTADAHAGLGDSEGTNTVLEDDDSVMFYAPLVPDDTSSVELARSEIVSVDEKGAVIEVLVEDAPPPQQMSSAPSESGVKPEGFKWHWPWHRETTPTLPKPKMVTKRLWVPSTEKLSLQVMWWGYRLWLPPPVLATLNDKEIEAGKLVAVLTTALQWLLNNVPDSALPPALRPALMLVKSLAPYLGYISGFIAWSWGAIKGFDEGFGVTLTATWLLPIALIPGTWEEKDVPNPITPSDPSDPTDPVPSDPAAPPSDPSAGTPTNPTPPSTSDPSIPPTTDPTSPTVPSNSPTTDPLPASGPKVL